MSNHELTSLGGNGPVDLRERAEQLANQMDSVLRAAVEVVAPGSDAEVAEVFSQPTERRDDDPGLQLTEGQEEALRELAATLGWGRKHDKTPTEQGLQSGFAAVIEGGQPHKVRAELAVITESEPGVIVVAGSPNRKVTNDAERQSGAHITGLEVEQVGATEYDVVRQVIATTSGFEAAEEDILPASYDTSAEHAVREDRSGQFRLIGKLAGADVILMRIDREDYVDAEGANKYRYQPGTAEVIGIVDAVLTASGDTQSQIGFVTSSTYEPSRTVDAVRAGLATGRQAEVVAYGTERLAAVRGTAPAEGPINQLPAELRKAADNVAALRSLLEQ